jgi:hypothetical protein
MAFNQILANGEKKADVIQHHLRVRDHVGLLCNRPPGEPECLLFSRPTTYV